jgi:hypothetical protein
MFTGLRVKYQLLLSDFNDTLSYKTDFLKINVIFLENPFSGSQDVPSKQMETESHRIGAIMQS